MNLGQRLKQQRENLGYSQVQLAQKMHVTRQAISRWENNKVYPSLLSLMDLAELYQIPVEKFLKDEDYQVVNEIDKKVNREKKYRYIILSIVALFIVFIGVLSYGRKNQISSIDRINPFLTTKTAYAIVPEKIPTKLVNKHMKIRVSEPVLAYVTDSPFGDGEWLKFDVGQIPEKGMNFAVLRHKGSYVEVARLIRYEDIPRLIRINIPEKYDKNFENDGAPRGHINPFY